MTSTNPADTENGFTLDANRLTKSAINGLRVAFGISGIAAVILGVLLLVWPVKTIAVAAVLLGIYFIVAGIVRLLVGIFSAGLSAGHRILDIIFGLVLLIAGVLAVHNVQTTAVALLVLVVAVIGIGWIVEGVIAIVESRGAQSAGWSIVFGIISIIAGIAVLAIPGWSVVWLVLFSGILLIVLGLLGIGRAFTFGREALKAS